MASERPDLSGAHSTPEQFAQTVRPLVDAMVATARRILGDQELARDAVQEALIGLWLEPDLPPNPRAWLLRAVTLRSLHQARTRARRRRYEGLARQERPEASDRDNPAQRLEYEETVLAMEQALAAVPAEYRDVLDLKTVAQMDYASIAETLQIPVGTVRSRLSRSRRIVRQILMRLMSDEQRNREPLDERPV